MEMNEPTRVMTPGAVPAPSGAAATRMGATLTCAVCGTPNTGLETYCAECGFLLGSDPGEAVGSAAEDREAPGLVDRASGRRFALHTGANTVGRESTDVLLMDGTVSRRHARVEVDEAGTRVTDLGSTNGTQVDGAPIPAHQATPLEPGSEVRFGNVALVFAIGQEVPEPALVAPAEATAAMPAAGADSTLALSAGSGPTDERVTGEPPSYRLIPGAPDRAEMLVRLGAWSIGRRLGNAFVIAGDPFVSSRHAELNCGNMGCHITDVGSTNGTLVNGERLEPGLERLLLDGDEVTIGQCTYRFETLEPPELAEDEADPAGRPAPAPDQVAASGAPEESTAEGEAR